MKNFTHTVTDPLGLHARPAGLLVREAKKFQSRILLTFDGRTGDAKKLFSIMGMELTNGKTFSVSVEGEDEEAAATAIRVFLNENL